MKKILALLIIFIAIIGCGRLPKFIKKKNLESVEKIEIKDNRLIINFRSIYSPKAFTKDLIHTFKPLLVINDDTLQILKFKIYGEEYGTNSISYKNGGEIVLSDTIDCRQEIEKILIISQGTIKRSKSPHILTLPNDKIFELRME